MTARKPRSPVHELRCADRLRIRALVLAGEPDPAPATLLNEIAGQIRACCGHTALKSYRLARGWTLDQAIQAFHAMCTRNQLGTRGLTERSWLGWEAGGGCSDDYQDLLCRLFHTSSVHLGFGSDYSDDEKGTQLAHTEPQDLPSNSASNWLADSKSVGDLTDRRHVITGFAGAAIGAGFGDIFMESAAEAMESTRRAEASDIGPQTLEHFEVVIAGVAADFAHTPPERMFPRVLFYRRQVDELLSRRLTLRQKRTLYRYAGWLSVALGWLAHDLGDAIAADAHCIDAWEHGWQAEDGEICGWSMDTAATVAMYNNRPERARDAAIKGLSQAPSGSAATVRLHCQLTRAYGRLCDAENFESTLTATHDVFGRLATPGSGLFSADVGRIFSYAASSWIWLGDPQRAVMCAEDALTFYANVDPGQRSPTREAISRLDLGLARLAMKTPDGAAEEAMKALDCERLTGTLLARATELDRVLRREYRDLPEAQAVHERLLSVTSAARAITA